MQDHIVQGISPSNTKIDLFDYWLVEQGTADNADPSDFQSKGINKDHYLKFSSSSLWKRKRNLRRSEKSQYQCMDRKEHRGKGKRRSICEISEKYVVERYEHGKNAVGKRRACFE